MTGLDTILHAIEQETLETCETIRQEYRQKASEVEQEAKKQEEALRRESELRKTRLQEEAKTRADSAAGLARRRDMLMQKQTIIQQMIEKAQDTLCQLPDDEYFSVLYRLMHRYAQPGDGVLVLGPKDMTRLPKDFMQQVKAALPKGASLTLRPQPDLQAQDGFFLLYQGIEENCTFRALFRAQYEVLQDTVQQMLFV